MTNDISDIPVVEMIPDESASFSEESPQEEPQKNVPWTCTNPGCNAKIEWWKLPEIVRAYGPKKILCKTCSDAKKGKKTAVAPATAPPQPVPEVPKPAAKQRRPAAVMQRAPVPRVPVTPRCLTLEVVELCAFRAGIASPQVKDLLAAIRSHMNASSDE